MKRFVLFLLLAALCALPASAKTPKRPKRPKTETAEKLALVARDRDALRLEHNRLLWRSYLDYARLTGRVEEVTKLRSVDVRRLCDTVPELHEAQAAYESAYKAWQEVLRTDSLYRSIHDEYISLKGINDREANNANTQRYNRMYARLARSNPDYIPARDAKNETRKTRDLLVLDYLVECYGRQGRVLPPDGFLDYSATRRLREAYPELSEAESRLKLLDKLCAELEEQLLREQYGVERPEREREKGSGYTGYTGYTGAVPQ